MHADAVAEFEGYEHAHWALQYRMAAIAAGFSTKLLEPRYERFFGTPRRRDRPPLRNWRGRLWWTIHDHWWGRKAYLSYLNHVLGTAGFGMIATKPSAPRALPSAVRGIRDLRRRAVLSG